MDVKTNGKVVVPCDALAPLIREWAKRNGYPVDRTENAGWENDKMGALGALAFQSGVSVRKIGGIMSPGSRLSDNVTFDTADRLLCAMHMTSEWHHSLKEYYQDEIETAPYERHLVETEVAA